MNRRHWTRRDLAADLAASLDLADALPSQPPERAQSAAETPEREPDGLGDHRFIVVRLDGSQPAPTHASLLTLEEAQYEAAGWRKAALKTAAPWKFGVFKVTEVTS